MLEEMSVRRFSPSEYIRAVERLGAPGFAFFLIASFELDQARARRERPEPFHVSVAGVESSISFCRAWRASHH